VHRDIKPENVLLVSLPQGFLAKWSDFGLSKVTPNGTSVTFNGKSEGTYAYMPPELLLCEMTTDISAWKKVDIFAVGILINQVVVEQEPYKSLNIAQMSIETTSGKRPAQLPESGRSELEHSLSEIAVKAWNGQVRLRPTASQLSDVVDRLSVSSSEFDSDNITLASKGSSSIIEWLNPLKLRETKQKELVDYLCSDEIGCDTVDDVVSLLTKYPDELTTVMAIIPKVKSGPLMALIKVMPMSLCIYLMITVYKVVP
jgi:serine/threonine protein kinase